MAVVDRLQILLFKKRGDQVIKLFLAGMLGLVKGVKPPVAFCRVARSARPYLIMNALDLLADWTAVVDTDRAGDNVLLCQTYLRSAVGTFLFGLDELPVLACDL